MTPDRSGPRLRRPAALLLALALVAGSPADAEPRTFTNTEGQTLEAVLLDVRDGQAVLRLAGGRTAEVPLTTLSADDQAFARKWQEENRNRLDPDRLRLDIFRDNKLSTSRKKNTKVSRVTTTYICTLDNFQPKQATGLTMEVTVFQHVTKRGDSGSTTTEEEVTETIRLGTLEANGKIEFSTKPVVCESVKVVGRNDGSTRTSIDGVLFELVADGKVIFREGHPENFLDRLAEEEEREARAAEEEARREEARDR